MGYGLVIAPAGCMSLAGLVSSGQRPYTARILPTFGHIHGAFKPAWMPGSLMIHDVTLQEQATGIFFWRPDTLDHGQRAACMHESDRRHVLPAAAMQHTVLKERPAPFSTRMKMLMPRQTRYISLLHLMAWCP